MVRFFSMRRFSFLSKCLHMPKNGNVSIRVSYLFFINDFRGMYTLV